jgi:hypothetical protein
MFFAAALAALCSCGGGSGGGGTSTAGGGGGAPAPGPGVALSVTVDNVRDKGTIHSGFLVGRAGGTGLSGVQISLDGGATFQSATGTSSWSFKLPSGGSTWKDGSLHAVQARSTDGSAFSSVVALSVRKGNNQDINGDGYADVVVGAPEESSFAGAAYVFHSSGATGVRTTTDASADARLAGVNANDAFGSAIALGDINGDGYADIIVGAFEAASSTGAAYIYLSAGPAGIALPAAPSTTLTGPAQQEFGFTVAITDIDGDGFGDAVIGAGGDGTNKGGTVYVFHSAGSTGIASGAYTGASSALPAITGTTFGRGLAVGDINGDGFSDVVVGDFNASAVYIYLSSGSGGVGGPPSATLTGTASKQFGQNIAMGDFNGDGYADVVVGEPLSATAYVFQSAGASGIANAASATATLTGPAASTFGLNLAAGDLNGDGFDDLLVGSVPDSTFIFHSPGAAGISSGTSSNATGVVGGFPSVVEDVNGDGYGDLITGQSNQTVLIRHSTGAAGVPMGVSAPVDSTLTGTTASSGFGLRLGH